MQHWLSKRLTPTKAKETRWGSLASAMETIWEDYFDPLHSRLERLRSSYLADDVDLAKKVREMGDYFAYDMPQVQDRPVAVAWRKLELEYKDMELILQSVFRRHFGHLPVTWFPLFAPLDQPYGTRLEPFGGLGNEPDKNIPPAGMFLTSRGRLGVDKGALFRAGLDKDTFRDISIPLIQRTKPLHIVYDGIIWYIRFDLPFESELSVSWEAASHYPLFFAPLGTRLDYTPDGWGALDSSFTLTRDIERKMELPFISDRLARDLWHLDLRFSEGFPEDWLPLDCVIPGAEGASVCPLSIFLSETTRPFSFALLKPKMSLEREAAQAFPVLFPVTFSASGHSERRFPVAFLPDYPLSTVDAVFPEGFPDGWLPLDCMQRRTEGTPTLPLHMAFSESSFSAPVNFVRPSMRKSSESVRSARWSMSARAAYVKSEERHFSIPFFRSVSAGALDSFISEGFSESMIPADLSIAATEGEERPPLSMLYAESDATSRIFWGNVSGSMAYREKIKTPLSAAHFESLAMLMGKHSELRYGMAMSTFPRIDQQALFDDVPADFVPLDICGGYANV